MKLLANAAQSEILQGKHVFIDNDFLGAVFRDEELWKDFTQYIKGPFVIDPLTQFEFLRDTVDSISWERRKSFVFDESIFLPAINHQELFVKIQDNALILSRVYAHAAQAQKRPSASLIDLFLAARLMLTKGSVLITGNKKDFPSSVFDTLTVMNYEEKSGSMRAISVIAFNAEKFATCYGEFTKADGRKPVSQV